ncbi:MAG TPA: hypothetical protein ENK43_07155 [Planctomycetes bacterium]|nr:hypothetical protein [Planctomycetota bacterium]
MNRFLLLFLLASTSFGQGGLQTRIFDVSPLISPVSDAPIGFWGLPIWTAYYQRFSNDRSGESLDPRMLVRPEALLAIIRDGIPEESWNSEGVTLRLLEDGRHLVVSQKPDVLKKIGSLLESMTLRVREPIALEALILRLGPAELVGLLANGPVLPAARVDALLTGKDQGAVLDGVLRASTIPGLRVRLQSGVRKPFVGIVDVEVAQEAEAVDPTTLTVFEGLDLTVRPLISADGKIVLRVQGGIDEDFATRDFVSRSTGKMQLPSMRTSRFSGSGRLDDGEALVVGCVLGGEDSSRVLAIRARRATSPPQGPMPIPSVDLFPLSDLCLPYLVMPPVSLGAAWGDKRAMDGDIPTAVAPYESGHRFISEEELGDFIRRSVRPEWWGANLYDLEATSDWLWLLTSPEQNRAVRRFLRGLTDVKAKALGWEVLIVSLPQDVYAAAAREGDRAARTILRSPDAFRRFHGVSVMEPGGVIDFIAGRESSYIRDNAVEIAQGADILAPIPGVRFRGVAIRLAPLRLRGESVMLQYDCRLSGGAAGLPPTFEGAGLVEVGTELPQTTLRQLGGHATVRLGKWNVLGACPSGIRAGEIEVVLVRPRL